MCSPADASLSPSRMTAHGSGPMRFATPSSYRTCTDHSLPVSRRTAKDSGHYPKALVKTRRNRVCSGGSRNTENLLSAPNEADFCLRIYGDARRPALRTAPIAERRAFPSRLSGRRGLHHPQRKIAGKGAVRIKSIPYAAIVPTKSSPPSNAGPSVRFDLLGQRRFVGVVAAIATLTFAYGLWAH